MDVVLVGGGGREAALAWKIAQSPLLGKLWVTSENPGFPSVAAPLPPGEIASKAASVGADLVVVGPEAPLADGLVDRCKALGLPAFGPTAAAARLESSKAFAKERMRRFGVPTAQAVVVGSLSEARGAIAGPCVIKADGLAAGKGVFVCDSAEEARRAAEQIFTAWPGGSALIEERLSGPELSVLALCDGERFVLLPPARDHKRRFDGDQGPNTGGMGAWSPVPTPPALLDELSRRVFQPVLEGMAGEGTPFQGCLYAGLMLTASGPKVLEFNCRFGDPECQPLVVMLAEDLLPRLMACARGELSPEPLRLRPGAACCVVMVNRDYPGAVRGGAPISGLEALPPEVVVFHSGTTRAEGRILATGGRVLGATAWGADREEARARAYLACSQIRWEGAAFRHDIATS